MLPSSGASPETEATLTDLLRQAPVWRKMKALGQLNAKAKLLVLNHLREKHPQATGVGLQRLLADRIHGKELVEVVYGPDACVGPSKERVDKELLEQVFLDAKA
jgi:hypothetical protein